MLWAPQDNQTKLKSHAVGMAVARSYGFEIDFVRSPFLDQLHDFSILSLNSFLHPFLKSKFMKNFLPPKKFHFQNPILSKINFAYFFLNRTQFFVNNIFVFKGPGIIFLKHDVLFNSYFEKVQFRCFGMLNMLTSIVTIFFKAKSGQYKWISISELFP